MSKSRSLFGTILIIFGILIFVNSIYDWHLFNIEQIWPAFILIPGLLFEFAFFINRRNPGLLVPGGILTVIGMLFFFETFTFWYFSEYTWPIYPLAVAFGLFQLYLFSGRHRGLLIPVFILTGVSCISFAIMFINFFSRWVNYSYIMPVLLIASGVYVMFNKDKSADENSESELDDDV